LVITARLLMPSQVKRYVNHKLQQLPGYGGSVEMLHHLWRGAYTIHDVNVTKKHTRSRAFVAAKRIDFSVDWREFKASRPVGEILATRASLTLQGPDQRPDQTPHRRELDTVVADLFPFKIHRFEIRDSEVRFHDFGTNQKWMCSSQIST